MDCERVREWSGAALLGEAPWEPSPEVRAHLAACAGCREEVDDARATWSAVRALPPLAVKRAGEVEALRLAALRELAQGREGRRAVREGMSGLARAAVVVLALGVGALAGWSAGRSEAMADGTTNVGAEAAPEGEQYLLLIRETPATLDVEARVGSAALVEEYSAWAGSLARSGRLVAAEKLADEGAAVSEGGSETVGSAVPNAVSGFFLVRAADEGVALAIARESPHVRHGGVVEVRRIEPTRRGT